jgi:hypothetical protein
MTNKTSENLYAKLSLSFSCRTLSLGDKTKSKYSEIRSIHNIGNSLKKIILKTPFILNLFQYMTWMEIYTV